MLRKKKIKDVLQADANAGISGYMAKKITRMQRKAADYLNRKTAGWSPLKVKVAFMLFFLVAGSFSLFIAGRAILSANGPPRSIKVQRLLVPLPLQKERQGLYADSSTGKLNHKIKINNNEQHE